MAAPGYGKGTDHFGIGATLTDVTNTVAFINNTKSPHPRTKVTALDEKGNIVASGYHAGGAGTPVTCNYEIHKGSIVLNVAALKLGPMAGNKVITSVAVGTSNSGWPTIAVEGIVDATNTADMPNFTLPNVTINAKRWAQEILFDKVGDWRLQSSGLSASGEIHHSLDEDGVVGVMAFTGAEAEITGAGVEIAAVVAVTWDESVEEIQAPTAANANVEFGSSSFSATVNIDADA